jgi:hypothetical protein
MEFIPLSDAGWSVLSRGIDRWGMFAFLNIALWEGNMERKSLGRQRTRSFAAAHPLRRGRL